ncbi:MAG: hypothetical protein ABIH72_04175 [archaeon]
MKIEKFAVKMDKLGVLAFLYVIIYAILSLLKETNFISWVLLLVGIGGFLIDSYIVIKTYLK